jgi:phospholipid transport system substrate-binding protein
MSAWLRASAVLLVAVLTVSTQPAFSEDAEATVTPDQAAAFIQDLSSKALSVLRDQSKTEADREAIFRGMLKDGFDMDFIGRFVLGINWRKATPQQRDEYQELFNEYVLKTYSARLGGFTNEEFKVSGTQPAGKRDIMVHSEIARKGQAQPITADWRVRLIDGQPKVIDVVVEGVSMSISQRQEFASVVQSKGIDGLLETLKARIKNGAPATTDQAGSSGT